MKQLASYNQLNIMANYAQSSTPGNHPNRSDNQRAPWLKWVLVGVVILLVVLTAIDLQTCRQQNTKPEHNTVNDNSTENIGKDEKDNGKSPR